MNREQIKELAIDNGFKLKTQPNGTKDLNPYVYEFAAALIEHAENEILSHIFYAQSSPVTPSNASEIIDKWPKFKAFLQAKEAK